MPAMSDANPYEAPRAPVADPLEPPGAGRPVWVWVICAVYALGIAWDVSIIARSAARISLHSLDVPQFVISFLLQSAFVVQLFRLKRNALTFGVSSLVFSFAMFAYRVISGQYAKMLVPTAWIGLSIAWALSMGVLLYVRSLWRRGVLR